MKTHLRRNTKLIITLAFVLMVIVGVSQVRGSGKVISESRETDSFSGIRLTCSADLYISQGNTAVTVTSDDNIIDLVETKVENGVLVVDIKGRGYRSTKVLEVHVTMPEMRSLKNSGSGDIYINNVFSASDLFVSISGSGDLEAIFDVRNLELKVSGSGDTELRGVRGNLKVAISGSGNLDADGLKLEDCYIQNYGSGDLSLSGKTNNLVVSIMGSGDFDGNNLTSVVAEVKNSGSSDITLHVVEQLKAVLNGSGDITYRGNPSKVDVRSNGSGDVYRK